MKTPKAVSAKRCGVRSRFSKLKTDKARVRYAAPKLPDALDLRMNGKPLNVVQQALDGNPRDLGKSTSARKFVRLLPALGHLFTAASMITARQSPHLMPPTYDAAPTLLCLNQCVRLGFSSLEMYALYDQIRSRRPSRREVHRMFRDLEMYLPGPTGVETWAEVQARVATARTSSTRQ